MMRAFLRTNRCGKKDNKLISKVMLLIFILVVVKNVCHKISLCEDSWSLLQLDFAKKKMKNNKRLPLCTSSLHISVPVSLSLLLG